jgi:triosephosphate isomerase (TIM)
MTTSASKPRPIVGGNWKMNTDKASAVTLARAVAQAVSQANLHARADVAVFPPFPYLLPVAEALAPFGNAVMLGAQDCYIAEKGAFTGEVSVPMLKDCGVQAVLVGHSERRHVIHEGDDLIEAKVQAVLNAGLTCVLCVGEKLEQRETGQTNTINERQVRNGLKHVSAETIKRVVIAYEPVWAIGTGKTATPADAQAAQHAIRNVLADMFGSQAAAAVRIQYGGSMNAANAAALMAEADINGGLIGGAALKPEDFLAIIKAAAH